MHPKKFKLKLEVFELAKLLETGILVNNDYFRGAEFLWNKSNGIPKTKGIIKEILVEYVPDYNKVDENIDELETHISLYINFIIVSTTGVQYNLHDCTILYER